MDTANKSGWWWLVENPGRKMPGKLTIRPTGGGTVEITGRLSVTSDSPPNRGNDIYIVHGQVDGVSVTLQDCYVTQSPHDEEESTSSIVAIYVYVGIHFDHPLDLEFEEVSVRYPYLDEWIDWGARDIKRRGDNSIPSEVGSSAHIPFAPVTCEIADGKDNHIAVKISRSLPRSNKPLDEHKHRALITVKPLQVMPFYGDGVRLSYAELVYERLAGFLSLATGKLNRPESMIGRLSRAKGSKSVQMHFPINKPELPSMIEPFFSYHEVKDNLDTYFSHWNSKHSKLREVLDLYLRQYHFTFTYPTTGFLNAARALEAYHRRMHGGRYLCEDVYKCKKMPVIDAIRRSFGTHDSSEKYVQDKLVSEVGRGNEYSFRRRLESICYEVLCDYSDFLDDIVGGLDNFIRTVVANRNQLTHVLEEQSSHSIEADRWDKYYEYVSNMRRLLRMCFLVEMEFPRATIEHIVKREGHWIHLR